MKLVIISGRSGSGKSTAINVLEDTGFYCIDNLPAGLLPSLVDSVLKKDNNDQSIAVCIDARNHSEDIATLPNVISNLPEQVETQVVYLDADDNILIKRFSETRRKHPLSDDNTSLQDAIEQEKHILETVATIADLQINTNQLTVHDLRSTVKERLCEHLETGGMSILFTSFGFKHSIPIDADIVYDVRCLPNPYWKPELRTYTGLDEPVKAFLGTQPDVSMMLDDIKHYLTRWLPKFAANNRSYVTIAIGCTGGMHRSVFIAESLQQHFSQSHDNVLIKHRELHTYAD